MGIFATIGVWLAKAVPVAVTWVEKAIGVAKYVAPLTDALKEGFNIFKKNDNNQSTPSRNKPAASERPDIITKKIVRKEEDDIEMIQQEIEENKQNLKKINDTNEIEHKEIQLQIDILELVISASTFERFTGNINLHASNLQIHLQSIQNTAGLLDSVNRQRVAIKALMGTVNHMINVIGVGKEVEKLQGLDIDVRPGSISIFKQYEAFENTRKLLLTEVDSFLETIEDQFARVKSVKELSKSIPNAKQKINKWLDASILPKLEIARDQVLSLQDDLQAAPLLESGFKLQLKDMKQEDL